MCGNNPENIVSAAKIVAPFCQNVDLNLGCPQGIARKGGYGAYLLSDFDRVRSIVHRLHSEKIPFSVKIRLLPSLQDTLRTCEMLQEVMCGEALLENPALFADGCDPATGEAIGVVAARGRSDA